MNNNNQINTPKKDQDSKKILTLVVLIAVFMLSTTGATYAYFAFTTPTATISGEAATASLVFTSGTGTDAGTAANVGPTNTTYTSQPMVPQISYTGTTNVLQKALTGATGKDKCVDANGNVICKAYTFGVANTSSAAVNVKGSITFNWSNPSTFANLRWKLMDSATAVTLSTKTAGTAFSTTAPIKAVKGSKVYFDTQNVFLSKTNGKKQYWLIVWIEETGGDQNNTDKGTWTATIAFDAFNTDGTSIGGLTSTITS